MQIILLKEECELIYESLLTERAENHSQLLRDKSRGRDLKYAQKNIDDVDALIDRFRPYVK